MKNLKKLAANFEKIGRNQMKEINGGWGGIVLVNCSNKCCPTDGRPRCPGLNCPDVVCPQYT